MTRKLNFVWIDDEPSRKTNAKALAGNLKVEYKFIDYRGKNDKEYSDKLKEVYQATPLPDLILIDHRLDNLNVSVISTGSSAAEILRDKILERPMVCVTGVDEHEIEYSKKMIYDEIYKVNGLSKNYETLKVIAISYKFLLSNRPKNEKQLIELLKAPKDDKKRLLAILPMDIKENFEDKSFIQRFSKWVRHVLMKNPGFLYDELRTATLLGVRQKSFKKISKLCEQAKYNGVFKDDSNPRWWPTIVKDILYKEVKCEKYIPPWELDPKLKGITKREISVCHSCKKPFPEAVAFLDDTRLEEKPMHLRCTISDPKSNQSLFFDEIRIMKGAD